MKKIIWKRLWARKYAPLLASAFLLAFLKNKKFGIAPNKMFLPEGSLMVFVFEENEFKNLVENYEKFLRRQNLVRYAEKYEQEFRDFLAYARKMATTDPSKLTKKQLSLIVKKFNERLIQSSDYQFCAFLVLEGAANDLEVKLSKVANGAQILQSITTPYRDTQITKARFELLKIANNKDQSVLKDYAKKYAWLPVYEPLDKPWTEKDFLAQTRTMKNPSQEFNNFYKQHKEALRNYKRYLSTVRDPKLKKQVEIVHYFAYLKEMRDDYRRHAYFLLAPFLAKLGELVQLNFRELNHLTLPELADSIEQGKSMVSKSELEARQKSFAYELRNGKLKVLSGTKARTLGNKILRTTGSKIIGMPAYNGLVKGKAQIIYHQGEFKKFKTGNILVTPMTHPEFLPIMKKAKAIVTDEGGITCHAAIVSRELRIPCIIGTKVATKVLKDGDMVEVDANIGIVRKI